MEVNQQLKSKTGPCMKHEQRAWPPVTSFLPDHTNRHHSIALTKVYS